MWGLDPNWDGGDPASCGCGACSSCRRHAANKWFASAAAADAGRAHPFCKCGVVPLRQIEQATYNALFVDGGGRAAVDLRYQWVQVVLAQTPEEPEPIPLGAPDGPGAVVRTGPIRLGHNGRRALFVEVRARETVTTTISIVRDGKILAHRTVKGVHGTRRIRIDLPPHTRSGPARLRMTLRTANGVSKIITRTIQIPRAVPALTR